MCARIPCRETYMIFHRVSYGILNIVWSKCPFYYAIALKIPYEFMPSISRTPSSSTEDTAKRRICIEYQRQMLAL